MQEKYSFWSAFPNLKSKFLQVPPPHTNTSLHSKLHNLPVDFLPRRGLHSGCENDSLICLKADTSALKRNGGK